MKKLLAVVAAMMLTASLSACNTVKGFGKDVEKGGEGLQQSSDKVQNKE
jgi:predicted small secreted protein